MKRMSKKTALLKCLAHWENLAETGSKNKEDYLRSIGEYPMTNCYCCEYASAWYNCKKCPLSGYAWTYCISKSTDSFYMPWTLSPSKEERQFWAEKIVQACKQALAKAPKVFV